ncbi:serine/threonine-protein kinase [Candidatus Uabimicrobium sp. HlEnr_7]|uniref:serine/threonine-protein kinase n=1 Tax=Candidatus Uabimicrobium helgolandensis TaxID=3095367 RepID=UPI003558E472
MEIEQNVVSHSNLEKRNRLFVRLLMNEKFVTEEMLSECLTDVTDQDTFAADIFVHKNYLTHEMVAGIYLKAGFLHCPYCHSEKRMEKVVLHATCSSCEKSYSFPTRYPFFKRKNSTTASMKSLTGSDLDHYRIQYCLGSGGMGEVYRALQKGLNRPVAIKILSPHLANNPKLVQRFQREAKLAAQLNHPNLVQIHDVGTFKEYHYIVMEYVDGVPLQKKVPKNEGLPLKTAVYYLRESIKGLKNLHDKEIIHRDIKPDNIMINSNEQVKLTDFGLAKSEEGSNDHLTRCGAIIGTPYYMSPEQCIGKSATKLSDIYSLGITFYYTLKGSIPYLGNTTLEIITQHINNPSPDLQNNLSPKLNKIYQKMVSENQEKRYQCVEDLQGDLAALTDKDYVVHPKKSKKWRYIIIIVIFFMLVAGINKKRRQKQRAKNKQQQMQQHKEKNLNDIIKIVSQKKPKQQVSKENNTNITTTKLKKIKKDVDLKTISLEKGIKSLEQLLKKNNTRKKTKTIIKNLVAKWKTTLEKRRKLKENSLYFLQEAQRKRWHLLIINNPQKDVFIPSQDIIKYLKKHHVKKWDSLQNSVNKLISIRNHEKNNIDLAKKVASLLSKKEKSVELEAYISRLDSEIQLLKLWENHFAIIHQFMEDKYYKKAYLFVKDLEEQIKNLEQAKSYKNIRKMCTTEKEITKNVWDLWSIFNNNIYDYMESGQQIKIKEVSATSIVKHIVQNKKKYKYKIDKVQIGFFYLFAKEFSLANKSLQKVLKGNNVILKLYTKHLDYLQR